jgi:hypothetical protein
MKEDRVKNRRAFLTMVGLALGEIIGLSPPIQVAAILGGKERNGSDESVSWLPWYRTIFCQFEFKELREAKEKCAKLILNSCKKQTVE